MTAARDMTMHWPNFTSRERVRSDIESVAQAKTEPDAYALLMGISIGAYVKVEEQREAGGDVREAARKAMEGL